MWKKLFALAATAFMAAGMAFAQVDVNKADQATLDSVKGIGPKISKAIVDERSKNGNFKDWADFEKRVKGIGDANSMRMSQAGLTVNGQSKPGAGSGKGQAKGGEKGRAKGDTKTAGSGSSTKTVASPFNNESESKSGSREAASKPGSSGSSGPAGAGASK